MTAHPRSQRRPLLDPLRSPTRQEFIEAAGRFCRRLGLPRSVGQIYGLAFFSTRPISLDEMAEVLGISKASASTGARQLTGWGALRQVWIPGDRRDYFEVAGDAAKLVGEFARDFVKPRLTLSHQRLSRMLAALDGELANGTLSPEEFDIGKARLTQLQDFQGRMQAAALLIEAMF